MGDNLNQNLFFLLNLDENYKYIPPFGRPNDYALLCGEVFWEMDSYKSGSVNSDNIPQQPFTQKNEGESNNIIIKNNNVPKENLNIISSQMISSINSEMTDKKTKKDKKYIDKKRLRKKKKKTLPEKSKKDRQNNKIIKIKTYIMKSNFNYINKLLKEKGKTRLCKLNPAKYSENINRNDNLKLFDMTLKEIYTLAEISTKYTKEDKEHNKKVIEDVYKEPKFKQVLDLTFRELLQIFIKNVDPKSELYEKTKDLKILCDDCDLVKFLTELRNNFENDKRKPKSEEYIKEYIDGSNEVTSIMDLCMFMEEWFKDKDPRKKRGKK